MSWTVKELAEKLLADYPHDYPVYYDDDGRSIPVSKIERNDKPEHTKMVLLS